LQFKLGLISFLSIIISHITKEIFLFNNKTYNYGHKTIVFTYYIHKIEVIVRLKTFNFIYILFIVLFIVNRRKSKKNVNTRKSKKNWQ